MRLILYTFLLVPAFGFTQSLKDSISEVDCEIVFSWATEMPVFPNGSEALIALVNEAVNDISCMVPDARFLSFVVSTEGKMRSPVYLPGELRTCSAELEKHFETFPNWIPGKQNDVPVCVNFVVPLKND